MKESISYSFLLNIIILFIFVCAAIIAGIFSYYRAFRAATMIVNEIEKFEGYNCFAAESISKKLNGVSYNLPFDVSCKSGETNCITDEGKNYKIYSYNIDGEAVNDSSMVEQIQFDDFTYTGAVPVSCDGDLCKMSSKYQYGVYTYMYFDLPIVSSFVRIPVYIKTKVMNDQRNLYSVKYGDTEYVIDSDILPYKYFNNYDYYYALLLDDTRGTINAPDGTKFIDIIKMYVYYDLNPNISKFESKFSGGKSLDEYLQSHNGVYPKYNDFVDKYGFGIRKDNEYLNPESNVRELFKLSELSSRENVNSLLRTGKRMCGTITDWSMF